MLLILLNLSLLLQFARRLRKKVTRSNVEYTRIKRFDQIGELYTSIIYVALFAVESHSDRRVEIS